MHLLSGSLLTLILWVLRIIESTREYAKIIHWFFRIIPSFSFGYGILNMANKSLDAAVEGYKNPKNVWDIDIAGGDALMLGIMGVVYFILVFVIEFLEDTGSI